MAIPSTDPVRRPDPDASQPIFEDLLDRITRQTVTLPIHVDGVVLDAAQAVVRRGPNISMVVPDQALAILSWHLRSNREWEASTTVAKLPKAITIDAAKHRRFIVSRHRTHVVIVAKTRRQDRMRRTAHDMKERLC